VGWGGGVGLQKVVSGPYHHRGADRATPTLSALPEGASFKKLNSPSTRAGFPAKRGEKKKPHQKGIPKQARQPGQREENTIGSSQGIR